MAEDRATGSSLTAEAITEETWAGSALIAEAIDAMADDFAAASPAIAEAIAEVTAAASTLAADAIDPPLRIAPAIADETLAGSALTAEAMELMAEDLTAFDPVLTAPIAEVTAAAFPPEPAAISEETAEGD